MFCRKCGCELVENAKFCKKCGAPVKIPGNQYMMKKQELEERPVNAEAPMIPAGNIKKKNRMLPVIIGASVLVVALLFGGIFFIVSKTPEEKSDFKASFSENASEENSEPQEQENETVTKESEDDQNESSDSFEDYGTDDYDEEDYDEEDDTEEDDTEKDDYADTPENATRKYVRFFVNAVNSGDYTDAEYCMQPGSNIYETQRKIVKNLYDRGIEEQLSYCRIDDVTFLDDDKAEVTSDEGIFVYKDGEEKLVKQSYIYTCVKEDGAWLLTDMR